MLFSLQRFEMSHGIRKVVFSDCFNQINGYSIMSTAQKVDFVEDLRQRMEEQYLQHCDMKVSIGFVTAMAARLILAKVKLVIYHSARRRGEETFPDLDRTLFSTSIEIIEYSHSLRVNPDYRIDLVDRAWRAVNTVFKDWEGAAGGQERRWRRIEELRAKALVACGMENSMEGIPSDEASTTYTGTWTIPRQPLPSVGELPAHDAMMSMNTSDSLVAEGMNEWDFNTLTSDMNESLNWNMDFNRQNNFWL